MLRIDPWLAACRAGVVLATGFGALTGAVLGSEVAEHWYQLYKMDKQGANLRFIYWWEDKVAGVLLPSGFISSHSLSSSCDLFTNDNMCYVTLQKNIIIVIPVFPVVNCACCFFTLIPMGFDMCRLSELGF